MQIDLAKVKSVYSGIDGRCCCGCSGKHTYASKTREAAAKARGYSIDDDEVSDRTVKLIVNKMNKLPGLQFDGEHHAYVVKGNRLYVAYFAD